MKRSIVLTGLVLGLVGPLASCAGTTVSGGLERSLAADPRLQSNPNLVGNSTPADAPPPATTNLPADFPSEIPLYPNATLQAVLAAPTQPVAATSPASSPSVSTRWQTSDSPEQVRQWYQQRFQAEGWQIQAGGETGSPLTTPLVAVQGNLRVALTVSSASAAPVGASPATPVPPTSPAPLSITGTVAPTTPTPTPVSTTTFNLEYLRTDAIGGTATPAGSTPAPTPAGGTLAALPQPGDPAFIGPVPQPDFGSSPAATSTPVAPASPNPSAPTNLTQAPAPLQPYVTDLLTLGALKSSASANAQPVTGDFKPNEAITRREFARWLVATNNQIFATRPANQIRLSVVASQPAFQDVPSTDPDFPAIQGLAEAGLIPSTLSGDPSATTFRPDAPLTRESLILWKVPLDTRRTLPNGTVDLVQQTWGFQDAPQISPRALRALVADYQNGDLSNTRRAFGFTTLFQPNRSVTRAEAAAALWFFGIQGDGLSAKDALQAARQPAQ